MNTKRLIAFALGLLLLPVHIFPKSSYPVINAESIEETTEEITEETTEESIEFGVWYTETDNGASYCWKLDKPYAYFRLTLKGNGEECIIPEYTDQSELPWAAFLPQSICSIVIDSTFTGFPEMMFQNMIYLTDVTILGNHYGDENRENDIPLHAFDGCRDLVAFYGDAPVSIDTEDLDKNFEVYDGETHIAELDPQYMAAYYGCLYFDKNKIIAENDVIYAPYGYWVIDENGKLWAYSCYQGTEYGGYLCITEDEFSEYREDIRQAEFLCSTAQFQGAVFKDCVNLETVTLPPHTLGLGTAMFQNCASLKEVFVPDSPANLYHAFEGCTSLKRIEFGENVTHLQQYAVQGCTALEEIVFYSNSFTEMNMTDFSACTSLEHLYLPDSTEYVHIINLPENVRSLVVPPIYEEKNFTVWNSSTSLSNLTVYSIPGSCVEEFCNTYNITFADVSTLFNITEENGVISGSFHEQPKLSWTLDEDGTLTISGYGNMEWLQTELLVPWREYRDRITSIVVESGIYQILDGYYFKDCPNAASLYLPDSVYKIDTYKSDGSADIASTYTIYAHADSYASLYAGRNNIPFSEVPRYEYRYESSVNNWSFLNTDEYFRSDENHFMLDSYREHLMKGADDTISLSKFSNTEKKRIEKMLDSKWNGSCWGMAVTSILSCYEQFDFSAFDSLADNLYALENSEEIESLLNYYWALQFTNEFRTRIEAYKKQKDVAKVEDLLTQIADEKPTLLAYSFPKGSHAVVAYGYTVSENGGYTFEIDGENYTYDIRINLYDNITDYSEGINPDTCMYVNTGQKGYYQWYIPAYGAIHNSKLEKNNTASISYVCSDVEILNYRGYLNGTDTSAELPYTASLETSAINGIKVTGAGGNGDAMLGLEKIAVYDGEYPAEDSYRYNMDDSYEGCSVELMNNCSQTLTMDYENCMLTVDTENAESILFNPEGEYISINGNDFEYEVGLLFNDGCYATCWYDWNIRSDNTSDSVNITRATEALNGKDGYIISSTSSLGRMIVNAQNNEDYAGLVFSTTYNSVLLYEITPGAIGVLADADNDEVYETAVSGDGYLISDVVRLQNYLIRNVEFTRAECDYYDITCDAALDSFDLVLLKRILVG